MSKPRHFTDGSEANRKWALVVMDLAIARCWQLLAQARATEDRGEKEELLCETKGILSRCLGEFDDQPIRTTDDFEPVTEADVQLVERVVARAMQAQEE